MKKKKKKQFYWHAKYATALLMLSFLSACKTNIDGSFCDIYEPVYLDYDKDTTETIKQVHRNNAVWDFCP